MGAEESEEETPQFALMHLEEEVCFMRQENRQLNQRLSGLEGALQEVIAHLIEAAHCQGGTVKAPSDRTDDLTELINADVDFEFLSTTESRNYHRECQRWIKKLTAELEQVMSENHLFPKNLRD